MVTKWVGAEGRKYWWCSSFLGQRGTEVEGKTFTQNLWFNHAPYRSKHRKLPKERQMFCTDIKIPAGRPEWAFVKAWNQIIRQRLRYDASFARIAQKIDHPLLRYRAKEPT
jgi:hypothetical protein